LTNLARTLVRKVAPEELDEAEKYCKRALEIEPRYAQAYGCLGIIAFKRGDLHQAEYFLRRSTELIQREGSFTDLGALFVQMARYKEAEITLNEAIKINPYDAQAHFELGHLYLQTGASKKAMREFRQAMAIEPGNDETRRALAIALMRVSEFNEAEEVLRDGIRVVDRTMGWRLHLALAQLLMRMGDESSDSHLYDEALNEVSRSRAVLLFRNRASEAC